MKRKCPTLKQWQTIRLILGNGWGDGDYAEGNDRCNFRHAAGSVRAFELWLEDKYKIQFKHHIA